MSLNPSWVRGKVCPNQDGFLIFEMKTVGHMHKNIKSIKNQRRNLLN